jgi:hypothetical protein
MPECYAGIVDADTVQKKYGITVLGKTHEQLDEVMKMYAIKTKPAKERRIEYQCQECFTDFCLISNIVSCPNCDSTDLSKMVCIYADDDPSYFEMLTQADLRAGD